VSRFAASARWFRTLVVGVPIAVAATSARAQPAPPPVPAPVPAPAAPAATAPPPATDNASDAAELEKALAADQAAQKASGAPNAAGSEPTGEGASAAPAGGAGGQSLNPDLSLIADFAAAYFSQDDNLETGAHDPTQNGFNLQQLELAAGAAVDPYFRFDANIVFGLDEVEIEEAYATTLDLPFQLQARFGQFLTRFGRINSMHLHAWDFVDQPFAIGRIFGPEGNRGLGVELSWLTPLPWYVEIVASTIGAAGEGTNRSFFGADDLGVDGPADLLYVTALKQFFPLSEDWSLSVGLSGAFGPNSTGRSNRTDVYGVDLFLKYRPITRESSTIVALQSEWLYRRRQVPENVLADVDGYAQLFWRFAQRWAVAGRYEYGSPVVDSAGDVVVDPLDPEWTSERQRVGANLTYWPSEFSRLRLQGARDMPDWRNGIWMVFLAAEVVVGAHGAHKF